MGWVVKTSPRACESVVLRARLSKCRLRRKSAPAGSPRSRRRACSPKACAPARGSRCARFDSGRGRFAAPLFLNGFVVLSKDSSPLKRRSCYQGRTQHSGYSPEAFIVGRASHLSRSPYPSRAVGVYLAVVRGKRLSLPREACDVATEQASAEGIVGERWCCPKARTVPTPKRRG